MTFHHTEIKARRLPLISSRATRLRILAENAINAYVDDVVDRQERNKRASDLIEIVEAFVNDESMPPQWEAKSLRQLTKNIICTYLADGATQRERTRRAAGLVAVIQVYMRREVR